MDEPAAMLSVEVVLAWPRRHASRRVILPVGATAAQAIAAAAFDEALMVGVTGLAVHGERITADAPLRDGDRLELLRPLRADPKEARRMRAALQRQRR